LSGEKGGLHIAFPGFVVLRKKERKGGPAILPCKLVELAATFIGKLTISSSLLKRRREKGKKRRSLPPFEENGPPKKEKERSFYQGRTAPDVRAKPRIY